MALVLDLLAREGGPLSMQVERLPKYAMVKTAQPLGATPVSEVFAKLVDAFPDAEVDHRDGLRLSWVDRWVHVRSSNTEPIVRIIAEAPEAPSSHALVAGVSKLVGRD